jgi:predicted NBD/HSP70 family sugar kinase
MKKVQRPAPGDIAIPETPVQSGTMLADKLRPLLTDPDLPGARIVRAMAITGATTAVELVKATGLARSTISQALAQLRKAGLILDADAPSSGMGRPTVLCSLNPEAGRCAGVLFGLDEIRIAICDMAHSVLSDRSVPIAHDYDPRTALALVQAELGRDCAALGIRIADLLGIGLAISAPVSETGLVMGSSILNWAGVDLVELCAHALPCPVHADNESHCGALAEMTWGAAVGEPDFVLIKFDLGIGGAIVCAGSLQRGLHGGAAEFGHLILDPDGDPCPCGNRGCLETRAGASHLLALAAGAGGQEVSLADFIAGAVDGRPDYRQLLATAAERSGWGVGLIGTVLDTPLFIITGGLARTGELFLEPLRQSYERHTLCKSAMLPADRRPRFVLGKFLANDTVLGAVALVLHQQSRIA